MRSGTDKGLFSSRRAAGTGLCWRPSVARPTRCFVNGVVWDLCNEAPWADLPRRYPPSQTYHRRFQRWCQDDTFERLLRGLAKDLYERGKLDLTEAYIDGTRDGAKKDVLWLAERIPEVRDDTC